MIDEIVDKRPFLKQVSRYWGFYGLIALTGISIIFYIVSNLSTLMESKLRAGLLFFMLVFFIPLFYYFAYRWVYPKLRKTRLHSLFHYASGGMFFGMGMGVWFIQKDEIAQSIFQVLDQVIPKALTSTAVEFYRPIFPAINFLFISFLVAFLAWIGLFLINKINSVKFKLIPNKLSIVLYGFMLVSVTACIYGTDFMSIGFGKHSGIFSGGTEEYVNDRIMNDLSFAEDLQAYGGFLYEIRQSGDANVYLSGTGFYGSLLKLFQDVTKIAPDKVLVGARGLCAILTAGLLAAISIKIKQCSGFIASIVFSVLCMMSYWLLGPASHLIWFFPVLFIPLCISIFLYPKVLNESISVRKFLIICLIGYFLVFLRSYVYAPVMVLSGAVPVFYYEVRNKAKFLHILWRGIQVSLIGVFGFLLAIGVHFIQLWLYLGSSEAAYELLVGKALLRGPSGELDTQVPLTIFMKWMEVRVFYVAQFVYSIFPQFEYLLEKVNTLRRFHLISFLMVGLSWGILVLDRATKKGKILMENEKRNLFALSTTLLVAMISSWTWFPALGHMAAHLHMNGIMYMIPFGLCFYALFGVVVQHSIRIMISLPYD
jgi:hypothetical protein